MTVQKSYVDYKALGDTGTATAASIQPVVDGEAASAATFGRPTENLRSRTEIARDVLGDLLYYRDRTARYLIELGAGGVLTWAGTGTGIANNTTQLILRPFLTPRTNLKGVLHVGTNAVNRVSYTVANTAYATDGMNEITVEHRSVPGTVTPTVTISSGPVYRILVVFDSAVATHNSAAVTGAVNTAIAGVAALTGKISAVNNGATGTAVAALTETSIDVRAHAGGTDGNATADVEAHTLAANALSTFTTANPLTEGDLIAIRYDYVIEPTAGDANDPKAGVRGGRAESNQSRSNADVSANLFIAQAHPEWLPGAIPLCKVVNGSLHWVDGTVLATGSSGMPGSSLSSYVNSAGWAGAPTLVVNGGIDNAGTVDTPQEAFDSVNQRLGQLRSTTWVVTDGTLSTGGHYNGATQIDAAIAATQNASMYGGMIYVRRGNYTGVFANGAMTAHGVSLKGETYDVLLTLGGTNTYANTLPVAMENLTLQRSGAFVLTLAGDVRMVNVRTNPGMLRLGTTSTANVRLDRLAMVAAGVSAATTYGISFEGKTVHATNCDFVGPDSLVASGGSVVNFGANVQSGLFENCTFSMQNANTLLSFTTPGASTAAQGIVFKKCTFTGATSTSYLLALSLGYGTVTFEDCTFTNTTHNPVVSTQAKGVTFVRCTFTSGTTFVGGSYASTFAGNATSGGRLTVLDCTINLGQLNASTTATASSVVLGGPGGAGHVYARGLRCTVLSSVTGLPTHAGLLELGSYGVVEAPASEYHDITLDCAGKAYVANSTANPVHLVYILGYDNFSPSATAYTQVHGLEIANFPGAAASGEGGAILSMQYATVDGLRVWKAPNTSLINQYMGYRQYYFQSNSTVRNARLIVFPCSGAINAVSADVTATFGSVYFNDVEILAYGTHAAAVARFGAAELARVRLYVSNGATGISAAQIVNGRAVNCTFGGTVDTVPVVQVDGTALLGCTITNAGTQTAVINGITGPTTNVSLVGNYLHHTSGAAPTIGSDITGGTNTVNTGNQFTVP